MYARLRGIDSSQIDSVVQNLIDTLMLRKHAEKQAGVYRYAYVAKFRNELRHEISNNVVCAISKSSNQPAHTQSLIRAFASRLNILWLLSYCKLFLISSANSKYYFVSLKKNFFEVLSVFLRVTLLKVIVLPRFLG